MFYDSHVHLDFEAFDADRNELLQRCKALGVNAFMVPGVSSKYWQRLLKLRGLSDRIHIALGVHPWYLDDFEQADLLVLERYLSTEKGISAVGEIGLDWLIDTERSKQLAVFEQQLDLAADFSKPVIIHHRRSHDEIAKVLRSKKLAKAGVIHGFSGSYQQAKVYIDLGFKLGVGGTITYPRAEKTRKVFKKVPLESLLLETDAPDMPLNGKQGARNSPEYIPAVFEHLVALRSESSEVIKKQLAANFLQLC